MIIKIFIRHKCLFGLLLFIAVLIIFTMFNIVFGEENYSPVDIGVVIILLVSPFLIIEETKFNNKLSKKCDPVLYLQESYKYIGDFNFEKKRPPFEALEFFLNKSTALIYLERYDEAVEIFYQLQKSLGKMINPYMFIVYNNMAQICLGRNDMPMARYYSEKAHSEAGKRTFKVMIKSVKEKMSNSLKSLDAQIMMKNGDLSGAEEIYSSITLKKSKMVEKVALNYEIGLLKLEMGKTNEAAERFEYVAQNGNTMACKIHAQEYLQKIREQNANTNI